METKPIQYTLSERKATIGKNAGQIVQVARATGRRRVSFRTLCEEAAHNTTLSQHEIMMAIGELTSVAKRHVENGDIVDFGDLGTLSPGFKSRVVPKGVAFNANTDIYAPRVTFRANPRYFAIEGASYERISKTPKKSKSEGGEKSEKPINPDHGTNDVGSL